MRLVEHFRWWVKAPGRKREHLTSFPMSAEEAQRIYPGARPEPSTLTVQELPETEAEERAALYRYQSAGHDSVKPPRS